MINLLDLSLEDLKKWMKENGEKEFRAKQVLDWIYKGAYNFEAMKNIPKDIKNKLQENFYISVPSVVEKYVSKDKSTVKFLFEYRDGNIIESVVMKYKHGNTICVSTQVGCKMGCTFCASTIGGVVRSLSHGEILGEVLMAQKEIGEKISNIVMMGSGEPLDNYDNSLKFIKSVNNENGLNIGQRHITLSTCGIVPKIKELAEENLQITLAISLHAPNDNIRRKTMPIASVYSIEELLEACKYYISKTNRRITFEYALVDNLNDKEVHAEELSNLLKGLLCHVNLIPINKIDEKEFKSSSTNKIKNFSNILLKNGIQTTIRREMGSDINAACGQLRRRYVKNNIKEV
ncbi:23S rRNA (adenine(2503)-C(2))-methyltransferase RlmN [Clostridium cochlearium]|jgi:23S rRNA (adenine2503-C2)-methyltransferase|uniref:23S rRNA (adenine(2503)-C(2))-methyltransferase RlmN n=1 Tax=Clostridium cochlearium TaxID=1494 RepID=UPI000B947406|nr:23S rRNA (adenine(2503)-C(2))-methyltransferase RlmN [Clostridium cochlearium]MBV1818066.1 23S rRNA (adenine(2503)-C(2))-methyltransferase RlmN [Bacteroidales bacterium MSK.15.36]NSJ90026.1 23S rRNA (adenine(2503)-C(2))-methyltransferase RlmN [Coprococcus sp. MSK.21.13]MBE6064270.1 23S rRNA (adenine(2503)-C(2))-methyltransferase RlmN [Clostridium cochlearium]MBU5268715.1 23S rRNA (adenine(2503)-C(2))-methyltransferase RlmN [Clostridium cochlearium]MCG4572268.1 23S rRNA (adenine(2503)-C(2))-